jgi:hypothetical protein
MTKSSLLNPSQSRDESQKASGRSRTVESGGTFNLLRDILNFNKNSVTKVVEPETVEPMAALTGNYGSSYNHSAKTEVL